MKGSKLMIIRRPQERDIKDLIELSQEFAKEHDWADQIPIGTIRDQDTARYWLFGENVFKVLVAEAEGSIIGYFGIKEFEDSYGASLLIDADYRGQGVGKKLTDEVFKLVPSDIEVEAWVADFNKISLKTTPKMGFAFKKMFFETEYIPGREFYVHIFTRRGEAVLDNDSEN